MLREGAEKPLIHGSGLGLWLTYWIVSNHDGSIHTDVSDDGTSVLISLPRTSSLSEFADSETLLGQFHREQDKFEAVFEESFDAIVVIDDDGRYIEVNEAAADLFALSRAELHGRSITEFVPDDFELDAVWSAFMDAERDRDTFPLERADGTRRTVEYTAVTDIVPGQHLAVLRDVTERIELERRYEALQEGFPDLCFILDEDGAHRDVLMSAASRDGLYVDPEEFLGRPIDEVLPPDVGERALAKIRETIETGERQTYRYELDLPAGTRRFEARTYPLRRTVDSQRLVSVVTRDITHRSAGCPASETA